MSHHPTSPLTVTHRSTVTEDQIDHLGHMNVRFYGVNARAASDAFVDGLGARPEGLRVDAPDVYTRHHREQLEGAALAVRTGVVRAAPGSLHLYHELVNEASDELAATFVHRLEALGPEGPSREWPPLDRVPDPTELPVHGRPRTIVLDADPLASSPSFDEVSDRQLAMRQPRTIDADECGPNGGVRSTDGPGLLWGGEPLDRTSGPSLHEGPDGQLIGWASMETRMAIRRLPRIGDRIQSFGATVAVRDKITHQVMWAYDVDQRDLLCSFEVVNLAFDTVGRRAVSIPDDLRQDRLDRLHEDLRPRTLAE